MKMLSVSELLETWERASALQSTERVLHLLAVGWPELSRQELETLPLGARDAHLARLRTRLLGRGLNVRVDCPACGEMLEFLLDAEALYPQIDDAVTGGEIEVDGYVIRYKAPDSGDLLAVSSIPDLSRAHDIMMQRCIDVVSTPDGAESQDEMPDAVKARLEQVMEEADPQANLSFSLKCPACNHDWETVLDLPGFFWRELEDWCLRLLGEIHILAATYGWSEREILEMNPGRRQIYLEMIEA